MTHSAAPDYETSIWSPTSSSGPLLEIYRSTVASAHRAYSVPSGKFHSLVTAPKCVVFVAISSSPSDGILGFALTNVIRAGTSVSPSNQHYKGSFGLLCVSPQHQGKGVGTALHKAALDHLTKTVRESLTRSRPPAKTSVIGLVSIFPRIFPGIPEGAEFEHAKNWFNRRGWEFGDDVSIDLYRTLIPGKESEGVRPLMKQAEEGGFTFRPPEEGDDEALIELEMAEFGDYTGWPDMFPALLASGHREDIECAFDKSGKIVGATVAALGPISGKMEEEGPMHKALAFPCTLGSRCAIIACVGVSSSTRGSGAGIALVASALIRLAGRGADGCFVDWVSMKGFYEKAGFKKWELGYYGAQKVVESD